MRPSLATRANMRAFEQAHPGGLRVDEHGNTFHVQAPRALAYSPTTGEEYAASSGEYFWRDNHEPLLDADGEPMLLVTQHTIYRDAITGKDLT